MLHLHYILASALLIIWCTLHSALISNSFVSFMQKKAGKRYRFYRLFFNLFALLTFLPLIYYFKTLPAEMLFPWDGGMRFVQLGLIALSFYLFVAGARRYDALQFLGLRQIKNASSHLTINQSGRLEIAGLHKIIRHPWYLGTLLLIWARQIDFSVLIQNIILTAYLIIGSYLEERKLVLEFGREYREYQRQVSMLFPLKWLKGKLYG